MEKIRILIVDDLPQVRQGLGTVLQLAARRTSPTTEVIGEARNGSEAIQQARLLQPDVILMDLEMPLIDGYEATRRIKAELPATRIIILSVHADPEAMQRARAAGADGFVVKGASTQDLLNAIQDRETEHQPYAANKGETP
jgi:DNA-binding NarL/FixJ family response regulator